MTTSMAVETANDAANDATVITGIGVVAPTGIGTDQYWTNTLRGLCGIRALDAEPLVDAPVRVAGQVAGFDERAFVENRLLVQTDRWTWMAFAAAELALADAALDPKAEDPYGLSVITASGSGGNAFGQREIQALWRDGPRSVSAYQSIGWFYAASSGQLSILHQLKGACGVLVADTAGGIDAVAQARRLIGSGAQAVVVGGTEAPLSPYALACQASVATLSRAVDPAAAYRPFATDATGFVPGEGGAMLVLERAATARVRGAAVYAEVAGTASTHDAYHPTDPAPDNRQLRRAMRAALDRAGCGPEEVDVVFADGAGDPVRDAREADAIRAVFGDRRLPVTVPKSMTGRLCSGGAALDLATAALALRHRVIPPTINVDSRANRLGPDLVTTARQSPDLRTALVVGCGVGGFNAAAVLRAPRNQHVPGHAGGLT